MKNVELINDNVLVAEVLGSVVCEKSDLVWVVPFTPELQKQILVELFSEFPISEN